MNSSIDLSCREAARLITGRHDRRLADGELASLEQHLGICDGCETVVHQFDLIRDAVRELRDRVEC